MPQASNQLHRLDFHPEVASKTRCMYIAGWLSGIRVAKVFESKIDDTVLQVKSGGGIEYKIIEEKTDELLSVFGLSVVGVAVRDMLSLIDLSGKSKVRLSGLHYPSNSSGPIHHNPVPARNSAEDLFLTVRGSGRVSEYRQLNPSAMGPYYEDSDVEFSSAFTVQAGDVTQISHQGQTIHRAESGSRGRTVLCATVV